MGRFIRIVKAEKDDERERRMGAIQQGYNSLAPFLLEEVEKYEATEKTEADAWNLYYGITGIHNTLLARGLGIEDPEAEREDGMPSIASEPIINDTVIFALNRISSKYPELKKCREEDENFTYKDEEGNEKKNPTLEEVAQKGIKHPKLSSFIADPIAQEGFYRKDSLKGILQLMKKAQHPLYTTLSRDAGVDEMGTPMNPKVRMKRRRVVVQPSFTDRQYEEEREGEQPRLHTESNRGIDNLEAFKTRKRREEERLKDQYAQFFDRVDMTQRGPQNVPEIQVKKPSTALTQGLLQRIDEIKANPSMRTVDRTMSDEGVEVAPMDDARAFGLLQNRFNEFMISLTGQKNFGPKRTRGGGVVGESVKQRPNAITPSMRDAAKELGIETGAPNTPDFILPYFTSNKSPFSDKVREEIGNFLENEDNAGYHPGLDAAMSPGEVLSGSRRDDERAKGLDFGQAAGSIAERASRAGEAAQYGGKDATESAISTEESEVKRIRGEATRTTMDNRLRDLERRLQTGELTQHQFEMHKTAIREHERALTKNKDAEQKHQIDDEAILGGLAGTDFDPSHMLHGASEEKMIEAVQDLHHQLAGVGRVVRQLRVAAHKAQNAKEDDEKREIDEKIAKLNLTAEDFVKFQNPEEMDIDDKMRYQALDELVTGYSVVEAGKDEEGNPQYRSVQNFGRLANIMPRLSAQLNSATKRIDDLGISKLAFVEAAMKYANKDMSPEGYQEAMNSLVNETERGGIAGYALGRLLSFMKVNGQRSAVDNEHQAKVAEQMRKRQRNHIARKHMEQDAFAQLGLADPDDIPPEYEKDIFHEPEECLACHPDRHSTRTAERAKQERPNAPINLGDRTPYVYKMMTVPLLQRYQKEGLGDDFLKVVAGEGTPSLEAIYNFIYPNSDKFKRDDLLSQLRRAGEGKYQGEWESRTAKKLRKEIKKAVLSGNPNAQAIYKKFGLYKHREKTVASGPAGLSNEELVANSFLLDNDDAHDRYHEEDRRGILLANRLNAFEGVMDFIKDMNKGVYGKDKVNIKHDNEAVRNNVIQTINEPLINYGKAMTAVGERKEDLALFQEAYDNYLDAIAQNDALWEQTKPVKVMRDGREVKEPGLYSSKQQKEEIKAQRVAINKRYKKVKDKYKYRERLVEEAQKKAALLKDNLPEHTERFNSRIIAAYLKAGDKIAKLGDIDNYEDYLAAMNKLHAEVYGDDFNTILSIDPGTGQPMTDYSMSLDNFKMGRIGEMGGTGIRFFNNNKARMRINDENMLFAKRAMMGHPMTEQEKKRASALLNDAKAASTKKEVKSLADAIDNMEVSSDAEMNHATIPQEHHDAEPNEMGLLTEEEAARREQNSHFTRGSEEKIKQGIHSAFNLLSNFKNHAPTLCGTCFGHRHVTPDEAAIYLSHHVPELKGMGVNEAAMKKYMKQHLRPHGAKSFDDHPHAELMEPHDHEQLACPDCDHTAEHSQTGRCANGLCSHCLGSGIIDPTDPTPIEGYIDRETGELIEGKNHHYVHSSMAGQAMDYANQLLAMKTSMLTSDDMPDFVRELYDMKPLKPAMQIYGDIIGREKFVSDRGRGIDAAARKREEARRRLGRNAVDASTRLTMVDGKLQPIPQPEPKLDVGDINIGEEKPTLDVGDISEKPTLDVGNILPMTGTHQAAQHAHIKSSIESRIKTLTAMGMRYVQSTQDPSIDAEFKELLSKIGAIPLDDFRDVHNDDLHYAQGLLQELQSYAEESFTRGQLEGEKIINPATGKAKKVKFGEKDVLPMDDEGKLNITYKDIFANKLPMSYRFYNPLTFAHGRHLSPKELKEGLFEPGANHEPSPITTDDVERIFGHMPKAMRAFNRVRKGQEFNPQTAATVQRALGRMKTPMMMKRAIGIASQELNDLRAKFGLSPYSELEMPEAELTFSDEAKGKLRVIKDADAFFITPNERGQMRAIDDNYTKSLNAQIVELFQDFVKHKALEVFINGHLNPLDHPNVPADLNINNYAQMTQENSNLRTILEDYAAQIIEDKDFETAEELAEAVKLNSYIRIPLGHKTAGDQHDKYDNVVKISPRDFADRVRANLAFDDIQRLPMGVMKYQTTKDEDGEDVISRSFEETKLRDLINANNPVNISEADQNAYDMMVRMTEFREQPNYEYERLMDRILEGEAGKTDGIANYGELTAAHAAGALPPEIQKQIDDALTMMVKTNPTLRPNNYDAMMGYDYAANQIEQARKQNEYERVEYAVSEAGGTMQQPAERMSEEELRNLRLYGRKDPLRPFNVDLSSREQQVTVPPRSPLAQVLPSSPLQTAPSRGPTAYTQFRRDEARFLMPNQYQPMAHQQESDEMAAQEEAARRQAVANIGRFKTAREAAEFYRNQGDSQ